MKKSLKRVLTGRYKGFMSAEKSRNFRETGLRNEIYGVQEIFCVQRFLDGLQRKVRVYPCKIGLLLTIFEKMPPVYVVSLFRANSSLAQ